MRSPISPPDSALANLQQTMDDLERQLTGREARAGRGTHPGDCTAELLQIINSGNRMRRRELFGVVAGAVILLPLASVAQHFDRVSHVGVLMGFAEKLLRRRWRGTGGLKARTSGSTTAFSQQRIELSSRGMRPSWSRCRRT